MFIKSNNFHKMLFSPKNLTHVLCDLLISGDSPSFMHLKSILIMSSPEMGTRDYFNGVILSTSYAMCFLFSPEIRNWSSDSDLGLSGVFHGSKYKWGNVYR